MVLKIISVFHILVFTSISELAHLQDSRLGCTPTPTSPVLLNASCSVTHHPYNNELSSVTNIHITVVFLFFPGQCFQFNRTECVSLFV